MGFATVVALSAGAVISTLGVNTHLDFQNAPSPTIHSSAISYLGFKHLRDSYRKSTDISLWTQVHNDTGATFDDYMPEGSTTGETDALNLVPSIFQLGLLDSIEGGNEEDDAYAINLGNSIAWTANFQQQVYNMGYELGLPVINMSFGSGWTATNNWHGDYDKVGDLSPYCTYANAHTYPLPGQGTDTTIKRLNSDALLAAASRPVVTTEIGWDTAKFTALDQAKFALDAVFDGVKDHDARMYYYALFDDNSAKFGLMNADGTPKQAGQALHNLTTILADTGGPISSSLTYDLSGTTTNDNSLLMVKSNGTFELAVWNETDAVHYVAVTLTKPSTEMKIYDPIVGNVSAHIGTNTVSVGLYPNHPMIIEITP